MYPLLTDSTAITFIGLGVGFGLLSVIALISGVFICMRIVNANRVNRAVRYPSAQVDYPPQRPFAAAAAPSAYGGRTPYY